VRESGFYLPIGFQLSIKIFKQFPHKPLFYSKAERDNLIDDGLVISLKLRARRLISVNQKMMKRFSSHRAVTQSAESLVKVNIFNNKTACGGRV
jgi:hypothetical protein